MGLGLFFLEIFTTWSFALKSFVLFYVTKRPHLACVKKKAVKVSQTGNWDSQVLCACVLFTLTLFVILCPSLLIGPVSLLSLFFPISKPQSTDLPEKSKKICPLKMQDAIITNQSFEMCNAGWICNTLVEYEMSQRNSTIDEMLS